MIRMIAEQLAGKRLVAQEVIAIERGDLSPLDFGAEPVDNQQQERSASLSLTILIADLDLVFVADDPRDGGVVRD